MPRGDREDWRALLRNELIKSGFSDAEADHNLRCLSRSRITSADLFTVHGIVSKIHGYLEIEKEKRASELASEKRSRQKLIGRINEVVTEAATTNDDPPLDCSDEELAAIVNNYRRWKEGND